MVVNFDYKTMYFLYIVVGLINLYVHLLIVPSYKQELQFGFYDFNKNY